MGGVAGHLSHLYDNRKLTFNEMKKILSLASSGELTGTEKTDGYNIFLGFKDGVPRAARNKGDMKKLGSLLMKSEEKPPNLSNRCSRLTTSWWSPDGSLQTSSINILHRLLQI